MLPNRNNESKENEELNNTKNNNSPALQPNGDDDFLFVEFNSNNISSNKVRKRPAHIVIPQSHLGKISQAFKSNLSKISQVFKSNKYETPPLLVPNPNLPKQEETSLTGSSCGTVETPEIKTPIIVFTSLTTLKITLSPKKTPKKLFDPSTISPSPKEDLPKTPENVSNSQTNRDTSTTETRTNFCAEVKTPTFFPLVEPLPDQAYPPLSSSTHSDYMPDPTSLSSLSSPRVSTSTTFPSASQALHSRNLERSFPLLSNENESEKTSSPNQSDKKNSPNTPPRNWRACCWSLFSCFNPSREEIQKKYDDYQPSPTNRTFMV